MLVIRGVLEAIVWKSSQPLTMTKTIAPRSTKVIELAIDKWFEISNMLEYLTYKTFIIDFEVNRKSSN